MINLLVISGSNQEAFQYLLIASKLISYNIIMHIVTIRKGVYQFIKHNGWEHAALLEIQRPDMTKKKDIYQYLNRYQYPPIAEMVAADQWVKDWDINEKFFLLTEYLNFFETYFDEHKINILYKFASSTMSLRAAYAVARRRNIPTLIINTGPIVMETHSINDIDEGWIWSEFFAEYQKDRIITQQDKDFVDKMVEKALSEYRVVKVRKSGIKKSLKRLLEYMYRQIRGKIDYIERKMVIDEFLFAMGRLIKPAKYCRINTLKPYIFFPLHIPWDTALVAQNPMFSSQEAIIEMLVSACPPGFDLYVKEHPYYSGGVSRGMFRNTKKFPTVKVMDPSISSLEIMRHAKAAVAIRSTAGWEAILLKKPLIVFGRPFYANFKYAYKVENLNLLPRIINEAIIKGESIYDDTDEWYKFLYSVFCSARKGSMLLYNDWSIYGKDLSDNRIQILSDQLAKKIISLIK